MLLLAFRHLSILPYLYLECAWSCLNATIPWVLTYLELQNLLHLYWFIAYELEIKASVLTMVFDYWKGIFSWLWRRLLIGMLFGTHLLLIFLSIFFAILIAVGTDFTVSHHSRLLDIASNLLFLLFIASINSSQPDFYSKASF